MLVNIQRNTHWSELTLTSPPSNILDSKMLDALIVAMDVLAHDAKPLVLRSEGKHFSTGYPIGDIPPEIFDDDPKVRAATAFEEMMARFVNYPAPVVAVVQGDAYGGALELLACADLRIAAEGVRLGLPPVRLGLVYSHTGLRRLIRGFGSTLVRELLFLGEPIGAERAREAGFFNRVIEPDFLPNALDTMMDSLVCGGPKAMRGTRRLLHLLEENETLSPEMLREIGEIRHQSRGGEEFKHAREAFLKKQRPPFGPRAS
jgi:enoyl-CoA hydratase/carnithine racemase